MLLAGLNGLLLRLIALPAAVQDQAAVGMASASSGTCSISRRAIAQRFAAKNQQPVPRTTLSPTSRALATTVYRQPMLVPSVALMLRVRHAAHGFEHRCGGSTSALQRIARKHDATMRLALEYGKVAGVSIAGLQAWRRSKPRP
jgi:hypothetical protein